MSKRALENYPVFPYIAWTLVIGFALFVYQLTVETTRAVANLGAHTTTLEQSVPKRPNSDSP